MGADYVGFIESRSIDVSVFLGKFLENGFEYSMYLSDWFLVNMIDFVVE